MNYQYVMHKLSILYCTVYSSYLFYLSSNANCQMSAHISYQSLVGDQLMHPHVDQKNTPHRAS